MSNSQATSGGSTGRDALELERLALENQKLRAELERRPGVWEGLQRMSPLLGSLLAIIAFVFGVIQYIDQQDKERRTRENELQRQAMARDQEFMKPLWERELSTYFLTSETVATIAGTTDAAKRRAAEEQFWRLYRGPLVILETQTLSGAMKAFGTCLDGTERCSPGEFNDRSLAVSSAIQLAIEAHAALRLSDFSKGKFQY